MALLRIVNASPLILLGKIGQLALLDLGGREVVVPDAVFREIASDPFKQPCLVHHAQRGGRWCG